MVTAVRTQIQYRTGFLLCFTAFTDWSSGLFQLTVNNGEYESFLDILQDQHWDQAHTKVSHMQRLAQNTETRVLGRANRLLYFDTTWTTQKEKYPKILLLLRVHSLLWERVY
jgi:hypothetical protein